MADSKKQELIANGVRPEQIAYGRWQEARANGEWRIAGTKKVLFSATGYRPYALLSRHMLFSPTISYKPSALLSCYMLSALRSSDAVGGWQGVPLVRRETCDVNRFGLSVRDEMRLNALMAES